MTNVVFWSPIHGQGANTVNTSATALMFALESDSRSLLTHTQLNFSTLESMLSADQSLMFNGFQDGGMDAIVRLVKSGKLNGERLEDYTETLIKHRLDLLSGSRRSIGDDVLTREQILSQIITKAAEYYEAVFIDVHSGQRSVETQTLLGEAGLVFVNLPQNRYILERFFVDGTDFPEQLRDKEYAIIISNYDANASWSVKNIKRRYNVKVPMFTMPQTSSFKDAINDAKLAQYFFRILKAKPKTEEYELLQATREIAKFIMNKLEVEHHDWYGDED